MSKLSNLIELVLILQYEKLITASELATILDVDKKTVYRYIYALNLAGLPVNTVKGRYGGFYVDKEFYIKPPKLREGELNALLMASEVLSREENFKYKNQLIKAVAKIKSITVEEDEHIQNNMNNINFNIDNIGNKKNLGHKIQIINESMSKGRTISIDYYSISKTKISNHKVDPYSLAFKSGKWRMIGYCELENKVKTFDINRIKDIELLNQIYMIPINFSLKDYIDSNVEDFYEEKAKVKIRFDKEVSKFIKSTVWYPNEKICDLENGDLVYKVYLENFSEFKKWILGFGSKAEVIEPVDLRNDIKDELHKVCSMYD